MHRALFEAVRDRVISEQPCVVMSVVGGPDFVGDAVILEGDGRANSDAAWVSAAKGEALARLGRSAGGTETVAVGEAKFEVFFDVYVPPPRLIIVGASQIAQSLTRLAKELGYRVVVNDARAAFATRGRFPEADEVVKGWPQDILPHYKMDDSTYIVLLSHDEKFDEPTLHYVLPLPVRYIGAIGSKTTQETRREKLRSQGFSAEQVGRIHGPIGLDLGGNAAEEVALSIIAEITAVRYGRQQ